MELNVLVIGMPNVGKSTLLNTLRKMGIKGRALVLKVVTGGAILNYGQRLPKPSRPPLSLA